MKVILNSPDRFILQHRPTVRNLVPLLALAIVACVFMVGRADQDQARGFVLLLFGLIIALGTVWQTQTTRIILDLPRNQVKLRRRSVVHLHRKDWLLTEFGGAMVKKMPERNRFSIVLLIGSPARYAEHPMTAAYLDIKTAQNGADLINRWFTASRAAIDEVDSAVRRA